MENTQKQKYNKEKGILIFVILLAFVLPMIAGAEFDNVKSYDAIKKEITLENAFGLPNYLGGYEIAKVKLDTELNQQVGLGYQKVFEYTIDSYVDYTNFIQELEIYNLKEGNTKENKKIDLKYLVYKTIDVPDYKYTCKDEKAASLGDRSSCTGEEAGSHKEQIKDWVDIEKMDIKVEKITISGWTEVSQGDYYEWVPNFGGVRINEWATWSGNLSTGLVSYWKMDESSGTLVQDAFNLNNGTNTNGLLIVPAKINNGLHMVSGQNDYVTIADSASLDIADAITVGGWFYVNNSNTGTYVVLVKKGDAYSMQTWDNKPGFELKIGGSYLHAESSATLDSLKGSWYYFAATYNGSIISFYINGVLNATKAATGSISNSANALGIFDSGTGSETNFIGVGDEVAIWNRSLTATELLYLYNSGDGCQYGDEGCYAAPVTTNFSLVSPDNYANFSSYEGIYLVGNFTTSSGDYISNVTLDVSFPEDFPGFSGEVNSSGAEGIYNISLGAIKEPTQNGIYRWAYRVYLTNGTSIWLPSSDIGGWRNFTIDTINPTTTLNSPVEGYNSTASSVTLNATVFDNLQVINVTFYVDDVLNTTNTTGMNNTDYTLTTNIVDGTHNWTVQACDSVHCVNSSTRIFYVDTVNPSITLNAPIEGYNSSSVSITFNATVLDNIGVENVSLYIDGALNSTDLSGLNNSDYTFTTNIAEGTHTWIMGACDNMRCVNSSSRTFTVDTVNPIVTLNAPIDAYNSTTVSQTFNATVFDNLDLVNVSLYLDGILNSTNTTGLNNTYYTFTTNVVEGAHTWIIGACDNIQCVNSSTRTFTIDATPPTITLNTPVDVYNSSLASILFGCTPIDNVQVLNVSFYLDGILNETNTSKVNGTQYNFTKSLNDGNHNWTCEVYDGFTNYAIATTRTFTVDTTYPVITLNYPTASIDYEVYNSSLELNFSVSDLLLSKCWYNYNGTNITVPGCQSGISNVSNITLSTAKSIIIYANDTFGNLNTTTYTWDYKVFENTRSYNTTVWETSNNTYSINITSDSNLTAVYLNKSGTIISANNISGDIWNASAVINQNVSDGYYSQEYSNEVSHSASSWSLKRNVTVNSYALKLDYNGKTSTGADGYLGLRFYYQNGTMLAVNQTPTDNYYVNYTWNNPHLNSKLGYVLLYENGGGATVYNNLFYLYSLNSTANYTTNWIFAYNGTNISSDYTNQPILPNLVGATTRVYTSPILHLTFKDEITGASINGTIDVSTWNYSLISGGAESNETFSYFNASSLSNHTFAIPNSTITSIYGSYWTGDIQFSSSDGATYPTRNLVIRNEYYNTSNPTNKTLYLLSSTSGVTSIFQVLTAASQVIEGAHITITRTIGGVNTIVAEGDTDSAGQISFFLSPNYFHTITVTKSGYATQTQTIKPIETTYTITMGASDTPFYYNDSTDIEGLYYTFWPPSGLITDGVYNFTFRVNNSYRNNIYNCTMTIKYSNGTQLGTSTGCNASAPLPSYGGWTSLSLNVTNISSLLGEFSIVLPNRTYYIERDARWKNVPTTNKSKGLGLMSAINDSIYWSEWGDNVATRDFSKIVFFFLFLGIILAILNFFTGYDTAYSGAFIYIVTGLVFLGSMAGGFNGRGFFYLDGAVATTTGSLFESFGTFMNNWILFLHFFMLSIIYFFTTNKRYQSG